MSDIKLPAILDHTAPALAEITTAIGIPRDVLASDDMIRHAWSGLPRVLEKIPAELRTEQHARMCVAVAAGLFDAAVGYAWNSAVLELRCKVRTFGLHIVPQVTGKPFDEKTLLEIKDAELLSLCLSLNLVDEDGYFFLDQCRDVRNNFSSAHPPLGALDDHEFLAFLNRCAKYALSGTANPRGVDAQALLGAVKGPRFVAPQLAKWTERLQETHDAQRELLIGTLHGIYCDPNSSEETRLNALDICRSLSARFTDRIKSELINRHNDYIAHAKTDRQTASQDFFSKLQLLPLLSDVERHGLISRACQRLLSVHDALDNYNNEPAFAETLVELSAQGAIPGTVQPEFVSIVMLCATGNQYGVSRAALPYYWKLIKNFSPREVALMLDASRNYDRLASRIKHYPQCRNRFRDLVKLVDPNTVPASYKAEYESWVAG
jgi:hypothetical protein